jgi:hypothetical protein
MVLVGHASNSILGDTTETKSRSSLWKTALVWSREPRVFFIFFYKLLFADELQSPFFHLFGALIREALTP